MAFDDEAMRDFIREALYAVRIKEMIEALVETLSEVRHSGNRVYR